VHDALQLRRIARLNGDARSFRQLVHGAHFVDDEAVLAREHRQRGRMARRKVRRITPEVRRRDEQ